MAMVPVPVIPPQHHAALRHELAAARGELALAYDCNAVQAREMAELRHELRIARRAMNELFRQTTLMGMAENETTPPADATQAHVDAVLGDLAQDKLKPPQIEQLQRGITNTSLRRAMGQAMGRRSPGLIGTL